MDEKDRMLAAIRTCSHDIRNSLTVVRANVQRLQRLTRQSAEEKIETSLSSIDARVDRMVEDLERLYQAVGLKK